MKFKLEGGPFDGETWTLAKGFIKIAAKYVIGDKTKFHEEKGSYQYKVVRIAKDYIVFRFISEVPNNKHK